MNSAKFNDTRGIHLKFNIQKTKIMASNPITSRHRWRKNRNSDYFLGFQNQMQMVPTAMKLKEACSLEKKL